MKVPAHRLIETAWPEFPTAAEPPAAPVEEFQSRIDRRRARMEEKSLSHLVVYGDREHFANLAYLTNFDPRFEEALLVIGPESGPLLIVMRSFGVGLGADPTFRLIPVVLSWNQLASACVTTAPNSRASGRSSGNSVDLKRVIVVSIVRDALRRPDGDGRVHRLKIFRQRAA